MTPSLPTGTVTFLFTDIEGSTRLLESLRDRYTAVLERHHAILREAGCRRRIRVGTGVTHSLSYSPVPRAVESAVSAQLRWL
jgi:class 3 adenylate cyclase